MYESATKNKHKSFFKVLDKTQEDRLEWLKGVKQSLLNENQYRTEVQRRFLRAYMGIDSTDTVTRRDPMDPAHKRKKIRKFRIPHINDIIETRVSQMTRLKPEVEVLPVNDEFSDRGAAKVAKAMVRHIFTQQDLDGLMIQVHRLCGIMGEVFLFVHYDQTVGDLDPDFVKAREMGIKEVNGEKLRPIRQGDVKFEIEYPWRVLLQITDKLENVEYYMRYKLVQTDQLYADYPELEKRMETRQSSPVTVFDTNSLEPKLVENQTVVWEMYHKRSKYVPDGYYCKFTDDMVLEESDYPFSMDEFNFERLTDLDLPGDNRGVSKLEFALPMQRLYDDLTTLVGKNIYMTAHAKMMVPKGSVKIDSLGNENTIVQYSGPVAPSVMNVSPNPPEVYSFRENIKNEMQLLMGSHGISRGDIPNGITAASALTFLNELESERQSSLISKHANFIKGVARKSIAVAADNYNIDEPRMIRIVGRNNAPLLKHFDAAVFSRPYDIRFESSSGFPETKAAQTQRSMEVLQYNPKLLSQEEWQYVLNIGGHDKLVSIATSAIASAESEVEDILAGEPVASPEFYEDHIAKLRVFYAALQSRSFKEEADNEVYENLIQHVSLQEQAALDKAATNPLFSAELANLKLFPITPSLQAPAQQLVRSVGQRQATVEGQANRGEEITEQIPGTNQEGSN